MAEEPAPASERSLRRDRKARQSGTPAVSNTPARSSAENGAASAVEEDVAVLPVVGIGASAGGIEALSLFFSAMPADSGAAFVVVLHLDPTRESQMAHILGARTTMPVAEIKDGMTLAANHVYVIAPDHDLRVRDGGLHLSEPAEPRGRRHPVDVLFRSLAADRGARGVAIVLSGTGTNGSEGLKEVKAEGGLILVQEPTTAKFDGMPRSAIDADLADHILAPGEMPAAVLAWLRHDHVAAANAAEVAPDEQAMEDRVLDVLRSRAGHDFRGYKKTTLHRRINRRLGVRNVASLRDYVEELRANPEEAGALAKDLMINVTGFFRDAEAWKALAELVIAPWAATRDTGETLRIWTPGCSTGEEAYSLAMLVSELAEAADKQFDLKIFATDAQDDNLRRARDGLYPAAAVANLSPARLRRWFDRAGSAYQVKRALREMIVFAPQNLLRDPPFSRLDLISCRNLLIYLEPAAQQRVMALCHFALREGGRLFLGNAETTGRNEDLFEPVSKKWRIFRRIGPTRHDIVDFPLTREPAHAHSHKRPEAASPDPQDPSRPVEAAAPLHAVEAARRALLQRYAPASVLIDEKCRILYFHGSTGDYLEPPTGEPTRNLLSMARDGLAVKLRAAVREAMTEKKSVTVHARVGRGRTSRPVVATITPVPAASQEAMSLLVSFEPATGASVSARPAVAEDAPSSSSGEQALQQELKAARAELQSTIEHLETTNEELKASSEEVTSANEELQSTNEELETSKEEPQSFNEELHTVNNQLQHKVRELEVLSDDLNNLLAGSQAATVFLDTDFCIKWFSPAISALLDLVASDIGRPISHFARKFTDENLLSDAKTVLQKLTPIEAEVRSDAGRWFVRRTLPYRTLDNRIAGVVISFSDITERKRAADAVNESRVYAEAIVETVGQPLLILDRDLRVVSANTAFYDLFRVSRQETEHCPIYELGNGQWQIPRLRTLLDETLSQDQKFNDVEIEHEFRDLGHLCMLLTGRKLSREGERADLILLAIEDITETKRAETLLSSQKQTLEMVANGEPLEAVLDFLARSMERHSRGEFLVALHLLEDDGCHFGHVAAPSLPSSYAQATKGMDARLQMGPCSSAVVAQTPTIVRDFAAEVRWPAFTTDIVSLGLRGCFTTPIVSSDRRILGTFAIYYREPRDPNPSDQQLVEIATRTASIAIERKQAEKKLRESEDRFRAIAENIPQLAWMADREGNVDWFNRGWLEYTGTTLEENVGAGWKAVHHPDHVDAVAEKFERHLREGLDWEDTFPLRGKDGAYRWFLSRMNAIHDGFGNVVRFFGTNTDITDERKADQHRELLIGELNHRVKNTLAIVQAIAAQTLDGSALSIEAARTAFVARLMMLAKAHDLLTRGNWQATDLASVVSAATEPLVHERNSFRIEGPLLPLAPDRAVSFTMALHELATNASKYGALSVEGGHVDIVWRLTGDGEDRRLHFRWAESGGPPVCPPRRKGFGSRMIERALAQELDGEVTMAYEPSGVVCVIDAPMSSVREEAGHNGTR